MRKVAAGDIEIEYWVILSYPINRGVVGAVSTPVARCSVYLVSCTTSSCAAGEWPTVDGPLRSSAEGECGRYERCTRDQDVWIDIGRGLPYLFARGIPVQGNIDGLGVLGVVSRSVNIIFSTNVSMYMQACGDRSVGSLNETGSNEGMPRKPHGGGQKSLDIDNLWLRFVSIRLWEKRQALACGVCANEAVQQRI